LPHTETMCLRVAYFQKELSITDTVNFKFKRVSIGETSTCLFAPESKG
jgi:hypothetical protein